jgi:hypothetical protein
MWISSDYTLDDVAVLAALFWLSQAIVLLLILAPVSRFYSFGWEIRKQDFTNRLAGKPITAYLDRFWLTTIRQRRFDASRPDEVFSHVYDIIAGRQLYVVPGLLLAFTLFIFGGLAIMTGLRVGYEAYVSLYQAYAKAEPGVFQSQIHHLQLIDINRAFYPFPSIALTLPTLASVAGAFLYTAQVVIRGYKARTLLSSDLLWGAFRLVISIPLGMAVGKIGAEAVSPLVGFGLGAFPINAINKLLRRLTSRALNQAEAAEDQDELLKMAGVTPDIAGLLNEEGIYSPQQLVDTDPVSLAVRTGMPFDFVVNLISQSQVWSWLGDTTHKLSARGYGDARMVKRLMDGVAANQADAITALQSLATALQMDLAALKLVLKAIAEDPYTAFLFGIT